jgi:hypothetical protein
MAGAGWILLALAGAGIFFILRGLVREYRLLAFPQTAGTMVSCEPLLTHSALMPAKAGRRSASPMWTVTARFSYSVGGVNYEGSRLSNQAPQKIVRSAHLDDPAPEPIAAVCRQYRSGTPIAVHYDPKDPRQSFVYFTSPLRNWPWILFPAITGLLGWFFLVGARFATR